MCVLCVVIPFILDVTLVGVPTGVTQEGRTGFLIRLPSAVLALMFLARKIQPFLSLVDRESRILCTKELIVTTPRFELTSQRQKVSRLPTEPPGGQASIIVGFSPKLYFKEKSPKLPSGNPIKCHEELGV